MRRITDQERIKKFSMEAEFADAEEMLDRIKLICEIRFPAPLGKPKRARPKQGAGDQGASRVIIQLSGFELLEALHEKFGFIALASDDPLEIGEDIPYMRNQCEAFETSATVTGRTSYREYKKQAAFAGYAATCTDCFKGYFKVKLTSKKVGA